MFGFRRSAIREIPEAGRGVVATADLRPGDLVCVAEPLAYSPDEEHTKSVCHWCLQEEFSEPGKKLLQCSACGAARYCGPSHQRSHWKRGHREECAVLRSQKERGRDKAAGPAERVAGHLLRILAAPGTSSELVNMYKSLRTHREFYFQRQRDELVAIAMVLALSTDRMKNPQEMELEPEKLLARELDALYSLQCNGMTICDTELSPRGVGLFPEGAFFNHSCVPNCAHSFVIDPKTDQITLQVRCISPVKEGEELNIAYIDILQAKSARRKELQDGYNFLCRCARCLKEQDSKDIRAELSMLDTADKAASQENGSQALATLARCRKFLSLSTEARCWHLLAHRYVSEEQWGEEAKSALEESLAKLQKCGLPHYHPIISLEYAMLGKLDVYVGATESAMKNLKRAVEGLTIAYGSEEDIVHTCELMLERCLYEVREAEESRNND